MTQNKHFALLYIGLVFLILPMFGLAQIQVVEAEKSDSTSYATGIHQDSVYIVYKGDNNKSSITLYADFNSIDSLNFDWYKFNTTTRNFDNLILEDTLVNFDTLSNCTIVFDDPSLFMDTIEGGYRVIIHNQQKNIDTTFTVWVWYQDFFINPIDIDYSTCTELRLDADTIFQNVFSYYDTVTNELLTIENEATLEWTWDTGKPTDKRFGTRPIFPAPFEETTYTLTAIDYYGYQREEPYTINEDDTDDNGYPELIAVDANFLGIHGEETVSAASDSAVHVEAPHGVAFYNDSKNGETYEWIFYKHVDWRTSNDSVLPIPDITDKNAYDFRYDSIFYERPRRDTLNSPERHHVKLTAWGPVYTIDGDQCVDTMRPKDGFVIVTPTKFPKYIENLPNVFSPKGSDYNRFYFVSSAVGQKSQDVKSLKYFSIKIYNRWGNKVYEFEDHDGGWVEQDGKRGWDGTTRVGTTAKPGVYFYTILGEGWDSREFEVGGFVHIF
ncbi:MAG: gliding motility-associated C-terminal domain-containing protein [Salinivirgaceae bacterium]|jgi:hypothetical protein|nr:gliding motility-associated C-terminal domain-containing protein [Salinivirgaceae bacterium]